jgi:LPS O-antigen subunit length determinant protein (WzzB/FepE family)
MQTAFNLVNAGRAIQQRWKTIATLTLLSIVAATATVFLLPPYFRSAATIVPGNPVLADKARLFNNNIQNLYSYFGSGDDIDRIYGIADMDTSYKTLVDEFAMIDYYHLTGDDRGLLRRKAVLRLRKDLDFQRTEQGQFRIIAWTKDKQLSANLVNRMVVIITETETAIWQNNYAKSSTALETQVSSMESEYRQLSDSMNSIMKAGSQLGAVELIAMRKQSLLDQVKQYRVAANEFKLASQTRPSVLYTLEQAVPAVKAERPEKLSIILAAALAGFVFSSLLVLLLDRKNGQ